MPPNDPVKPLGKPRGSIYAPMAAFVMAILLGTYSITSIRSARRDTQGAPPTSPQGTVRSYRERTSKPEQPAWMQEALEASREAERSKGSK